MRGIACMAVGLMLLGTAPREVKVGAGESLEDIAARELGDRKAAAELRALNDLGEGAVAPGTTVRIPGEERNRARRALHAARNAILQRDGGSVGEALARLSEAEAHFSAARYVEAAQSADAAWRLVSDSAQPGTAFTVEVEPSGETKVISRRGQPVRVEAQGVQRPVEPGTMVRIVKGAPPSAPKSRPAAPVPTAPADKAVLKLRPNEKGALGPVKLTWRPAEGARAYAVEILPEAEGRDPVRLTSTRPEVSVPPLPEGRYFWTVRALGESGLDSEKSGPRAFTLEPGKLKLEVRGASWK